MRRFLSLILILLLSFSAGACSPKPEASAPRATAVNTQPRPAAVSSGRYPVQQATYDDGTGLYTLLLLNTPPGQPASFQTENLRMARLTQEQIDQGEKTFVEIQGADAELYLTEDFKIEYVHSVTETQTNPATGQPETVVVRRESNFWSPFAGALAGQALGSLLFRPQYYFPPVYSGAPLTGFGGYGSSYNQAVDSYRSRNQTAPPAVKNRQTVRATGNLRKPSPSNTATRRPSQTNTKSTGAGASSSRLRSSGASRPSQARPSSRSFGSSRPSGRSYSRGGGRRR
ncbi:MAG: hypothetical protein GC158_06590 [Cyanobacteria bacterium RI_101]|nr:hypothetical protein [Cyanobacteria bacterium RI_101]